MFAVPAIATSQQSTAAHALQSSKLSSSTSKYFAAFFRYLRTGQRVTKRIQGCCQTFAIVNTVTVFMHQKGTRATLLLLIFNGTLYQRMWTKTGSTCSAWKTLVEAIILGRGHSYKNCASSLRMYSNDKTTLLTQKQWKKKTTRTIHDIQNPYALLSP